MKCPNCDGPLDADFVVINERCVSDWRCIMCGWTEGREPPLMFEEEEDE